jgi:hypothetical protein
MKIKSVELRHLDPYGKYYETEVLVKVEDEIWRCFTIRIDITGYYPKPSQREIDNGWEPDEGMDHVEPEACHLIAEMIVDCLLEKTQEK